MHQYLFKNIENIVTIWPLKSYRSLKFRYDIYIYILDTLCKLAVLKKKSYNLPSSDSVSTQRKTFTTLQTTVWSKNSMIQNFYHFHQDIWSKHWRRLFVCWQIYAELSWKNWFDKNNLSACLYRLSVKLKLFSCQTSCPC